MPITKAGIIKYLKEEAGRLSDILEKQSPSEAFDKKRKEHYLFLSGKLDAVRDILELAESDEENLE